MNNKYYWILPVAWMGVIFYASSMPYENQDIKPALTQRFDLTIIKPLLDDIVFTYHQTEISVEALGLERFVEFLIRKGAHVFVFFVLAYLFYLALSKTTRLTLNTRLVLSFVFSVIYAMLDEWHQSFTPNRTAYIGDVIIDAVGALIAVCLIFIIMNFKAKQKPSHKTK